MGETAYRTEQEQAVNLETLRIAATTREQVQCMDDLSHGVLYPTGCFSRWILPRGRRLSESLSNDPAAPTPFVVPRAASAKCFTREQIEAYLGRLEHPVDVSHEISRAAADMQRRADDLSAKMAGEIHKAAAQMVSDLRDDARDFVNSFMAKNTIAVSPNDYGRTCGVYFLRRHGVVIYVGQSVNILARINQHVSAGKIIFDEVEYLRCDQSDLNDYEGFFIRFLRPAENGWGRVKEHAAPQSRLWEKFARLQFRVVDGVDESEDVA